MNISDTIKGVDENSDDTIKGVNEIAMEGVDMEGVKLAMEEGVITVIKITIYVQPSSEVQMQSLKTLLLTIAGTFGVEATVSFEKLTIL